MGGSGAGNSDGTAMGFLKNFLMGGTAGVISKTSCAPLERVKIVLQNQAALENATKQYSGLLGTGKAIVKEQVTPFSLPSKLGFRVENSS